MKTFVYLILFFTIALQGQSITGIVADGATQAPLPYASVILYDESGAQVSGTTADGGGHYSLAFPDHFSKGTIVSQYVGFEVFRMDVDTASFSPKLDIVLHPAATELGEVSIVNRQRAISFKGDRLVVDVAKMGIADGNNGLETLRLLPGMRLDKDDNLLFRGSADIQVMINGKKSLLQGDALREYIRSLRGSDIEKVEIIAQPSSRYEASGTAGILNIVLKRNKGQGFGGSVNSWMSYGEFLKQQQGGRAFYSDSLWTVSGNASYYDGKSFNRRNVDQVITTEEGVRSIDQWNEWLPVTVSKNVSFAVERRLGKKHLVSTEWQYADSDSDEKTQGTTDEFLDGSPVKSVSLTQHMQVPTRRITGNVFYNFTNDTISKLDIQANMVHYRTGMGGFQRNEYSGGEVMQLDGENGTRYGVTALQADFNRKLSKRLDFEVGVRYSHVDMRYHNRYDTANPELLLLPDSLLVNTFSYRENLASAYTQLSYSLEKWSFLAGMRVEGYRYKALSLVNGDAFTGGTTNLFPSASVNYKKDDHQYQFSYSRRIGRPGYLSLNPYYQYLDAYTVSIGNPELRPQFYHSFQLGYTYKSALNVSLYGYLYDNGFTNVIDYLEDGNYNVTYQANAASGNRFGLSASMSYEKGIWSMQLSLDAAYAGERSDIPGFAYDGHGFGYDISLYQSLKFKTNWTVTANGFYSGRATTPNGHTRENYDLSFSVKKSLLDKKLQLMAGCTDFLKKSRYSAVTEVGNTRTDWTNRWETGRFYLQATYNFGGANAKKVKEASVDSESSRM